MREEALTQASARLEQARTDLDRLRQARLFSELEQAWARFLISTKLVFAKLGAGAKGCPKSEGWFGNKLHEQRTDPMLAFLYQARNAEEHGLDRLVSHAYEVRPVPGVALDLTAVPQATGDIIFHLTGAPDQIVHLPLTGALTSIFDPRSKRVFDPPRVHLKSEITPTAFTLGEMAIAYLQNTLEEARALPSRA